MNKLFQFTRDYLFNHGATKRAPERTESDHGLVVTGDALVQSIYDAIRLRRSVLVSGPRGCGKTFCVKQAIKRAYNDHKIGGWHFLQGNREIPRDYLSEDMLVINRDAQPQLLDALAIRPPASWWARNRSQQMRTQEAPPMSPGTQPLTYPAWPAIPALTLHELRLKHANQHWTPWSEERDWVVLFLDEINRFGDGFLDSLLSLTEEGIIVRGGDEYHVPVVVVATANPPGYDVTAKKLSPPLQARIGRSYRVSQPPLDHLVQVVLPSKEEMFGDLLGRSVTLDESTRYLAAAATLCLWGDPDSGVRGAAFLTAGTRALLRAAMRRNVVVDRAMQELTTLIQFGPDARAIGEWIGAAAAEAMREGASHVTAAHLTATAGPVLGHKLRESFNEGAEPDKVTTIQRCIHQVVSTVLSQPAYAELFVLPYAEAARRLGLSERELFLRLTQLPGETRWHSWLRALADLDVGEDVGSFDRWRMRHTASGTFSAGGSFITFEERAWFEKVLVADAAAPAPGAPAGASDAVQAPGAPQAALNRRRLLAKHLGVKPLTNVETSLRNALGQRPYAAFFTQQLIDIASKNVAFLNADANGTVQRAWVETLDEIINPHGGKLEDLLEKRRAELARTSNDEQGSARVLLEALRAIHDEAGDAVEAASRDRVDEALQLVNGKQEAR